MSFVYERKDILAMSFVLTFRLNWIMLSTDIKNFLHYTFCQHRIVSTFFLWAFGNVYFLPTLRIIWTLLLVFPLLLYIEYFYHMFIFFLLYSTGFVHIYIYYFVMCYVLSSYVFIMTFGVFFTSKTLNIFPWGLCWEKLMKFINLA